MSSSSTMASQSVAVVLFLLPFLACVVNGKQVLDIRNFGAKANGDISNALLSAWNQAKSSAVPVRIVIPKGTWPLTQVKLCGPNTSPIEIQVQGEVRASGNIRDMKNPMADWITFMYIDGLEISGGGVFNGQGQQAWRENNCVKKLNCKKLPLNLSFNFISNAYIHDVTTKDSKNFHTNCNECKNVKFERYTVSAPGDSPNTDGLHIARSSNVHVLNSKIATGDDCISIGDDSQEIYITGVTCGPGHGISIGSLGRYSNEKNVKGVYIRQCTFIKSTNGVRVKSWPGSTVQLTASNLHFEDLQMKDVGFPIIIDQQYCPNNLCNKNSPSKVRISDVFIKNIQGTSNTEEAVVLRCSKSYPCQNVQIGNINLKYIGTMSTGPGKSVCNNVKPKLYGKQYPAVCASN